MKISNTNISSINSDYQYLYDAGVVAIFGPGTNVAAAGKKILEVLLAAHEE
jgi:methylmalonyl-CoA mutase